MSPEQLEALQALMDAARDEIEAQTRRVMTMTGKTLAASLAMVEDRFCQPEATVRGTDTA